MKRLTLFFTIIAIAASFAGHASAAGDDPVIYFEIPKGLFAEACGEKVWSGVTARFAGVKDLRERKELGIQTKGDEEVQIHSQPAIEIVLNDALRELFTECGMALTDRVSEEGTVISADLREFFVDVVKSMVSGKSSAQSLITFHVKGAGRVSSIDVGMEVDSKDVRRKGVKAVGRAANRLLAETIKAIPQNRYMREAR